jgi:hypothetical protein
VENQPTIQARASTLTFGAILLGIVGGIVGIIIGLLLGLLLGSILASSLNVSTREGEAGYFMVAVGLIVTAVVAPLTIIFTLYWRGVRKVWLLLGLIIVCVSIFGIAAAGVGAWYMTQPHILNTNGPTPLLKFEVKGPGVTAESIGKFEVELDTNRNPRPMPGNWHDSTNDAAVRAGYVEMYFKTSRRWIVLRSPEKTDRIFNLTLPANPMRPRYREWSDWKKPDWIAKGEQQPARFTGGEEFQIRYKVDYQDR